MLPPMPELPPPLSCNDLVRINILPRPQVLLPIVQVDGLVDMPVGLQRGVPLSDSLPELMLVIRAVEPHLNAPRCVGKRVRKVHRREALPSLRCACRRLPFREGNLLPLGSGDALGAEIGLVPRLEDTVEVRTVGVGDGDVVVKGHAAEDVPLAPGGVFAEQGLGLVGGKRKDQFVVRRTEVV